MPKALRIFMIHDNFLMQTLNFFLVQMEIFSFKNNLDKPIVKLILYNIIQILNEQSVLIIQIFQSVYQEKTHIFVYQIHIYH